ncbi:MAG: cation:proton antiporter, partial [Syntrophaceae bacterium]|nr:cation:proton antiporter [Syntrophaceae bacterium]
MNHELSMLLTIVFAAGFGLLAQVLSRRLRIPAIVVLLLFGIIIGKDFLNIIDPSVLGGGMVIVIKLAVAIILFEGALNLRLNSLRNSIREVRNLVSFGVLFTWVMISVASHYMVGLSWQLAILFGALMTVTGPTVVQPLLKRINISKK